MQTYQLKVALRGVSPMVWRRLEMSELTSLAELHHIIQAAFGWDNEYLHQFHIYGKAYGIGYIGGLSFSDNAYDVLLSSFEFDVGDKFSYEYNFFAYWVVNIRIEKITQEDSRCSPKCIKGNGMPGVKACDVIHAKVNLLQALAKADESTLVADLLPEIEAYQSILLNRKSINKNIHTELAVINH